MVVSVKCDGQKLVQWIDPQKARIDLVFKILVSKPPCQNGIDPQRPRIDPVVTESYF